MFGEIGVFLLSLRMISRFSGLDNLQTVMITIKYEQIEKRR